MTTTDNYTSVFSVLQSNKFLLLLLIILPCILFWPATHVFFVGDDFFWLYHAKYDMSTVSGWFSAFVHSPDGNTYRPLTQDLFFWVCWRLFGQDPFGYHLVDFAVFVATALVLYHVLYYLSELRFVSWLATIVWELSITHYSALNWVSAFSETGAVFSFSLCLLFLVRNRCRMTVFVYIISLLCNESTSVFPAVAFVYLIIMKKQGPVGAIQRTLGLWVAFVCYIVLRLTVIGLHPQGAFSINMSLSHWAMLAVQSAWWCMGMVPPLHNVLQLSPFGFTIYLAFAAFMLIILASLTVGLYFNVKTKPRVISKPVAVLFLGVIWYFLGLLPLLPFSNNYSDYNLSIPMIGICVCLAGILMMVKFKRLIPLGLACCFGIVSFCGQYGPGGMAQVQGVTVLAQTSYFAYVQMLAQQQRHPGALSVTVDSNNSALVWTLRQQFLVKLFNAQSTIHYGKNNTRAELQFIYDPHLSVLSVKR